jgi:uncharacterized protein (DUF952 family)
MILHLLPRAEWEAAPADQPYRSPSLEHEGFIHATQGDALLLMVANGLYKDHAGDFVALEIDEARLTSAVRWEAPAGTLPPEASAEETTPLFPHIYGPINREAIVGVRLMQRAADGTFVGYAPLSGADAANPLNLKSPSQLAVELLEATDAFSEALGQLKDRLENRLRAMDEEIKKHR